MPLTYSDDTPTFEFNRTNFDFSSSKLDQFKRNMNDKLEAITKDSPVDWIYPFLDIVVVTNTRQTTEPSNELKIIRGE